MVSNDSQPVPLPTSHDLRGRRVWVAGHRGMVGKALVRRLEREACETMVVPRQEVDLRRQVDVERWMQANRPEYVFIAAATVGGILANSTRPAEFLYDNLQIAGNIIEAAYRVGVTKLLFLGSSCIYPRLAEQPIRESALLTGPLEPTNEWYALAKIAGVKLCAAYRQQYGCDFISAMPSNLYGPGDNYDLRNSHVLPALIRRIHTAKLEDQPQVELWGTGTPKREFMYVDDCADAVTMLMKTYSGAQHLNIGTGEDVSIRELAEIVAEVVGYRGRFVFDTTRPDGVPRKLLDVSLLRSLGWQASVDLKHGIKRTYDSFLTERDSAAV